MLFLSCCAIMAVAQQSPNGKLTVQPGTNTLTVRYGQQTVIEVETSDDAMALGHCEPRRIVADYEMLSGKKRHCTNEANEYRSGALVLRVYNDGIALRYEGEGLPMQEPTAYRIAEGTPRWMQQWAESYEGFFPLSTTARVKPVPSFSGTFASADGFNIRWGYPALLQPAEGVFALITESNIERQQSASCLFNDGERFRVVPDRNEARSQGPWHTPWRVVIVGTLADVVASTLVTDVAEPCQLADTSWIRPGVVSWVYWAYNHGSSDFGIIRKYVDMAATLHLPYVLIDAEWDVMRDGKTVEDAVAYAVQRGVKPMIWYNSSVGWTDGAPTPKFRLNKEEDREREFAWCERIGVAGVKIDFFSGDNQMNMDYCLDLLESAARHHLLVNFHGATIPRGWQRTYPNLLSTEGVYGAEWYNNVASFTAQAACHNATLPFTRNVIGPMDYTPCAFSDSQHPHITTHCHELALTVLFESGLQHLADSPESFLSQPQEVQQFLGQLPSAWDETRYVSGYPGESVVLARRKGNKWYVAGINGTDYPKVLSVPLDFIKGKKLTATLFSDGEIQAKKNTATLQYTSQPWTISSVGKLPKDIPCKPRGGFVLLLSDGM